MRGNSSIGRSWRRRKNWEEAFMKEKISELDSGKYICSYYTEKPKTTTVA